MGSQLIAHPAAGLSAIHGQQLHIWEERNRTEEENVLAKSHVWLGYHENGIKTQSYKPVYVILLQSGETWYENWTMAKS